MIRFHAFALTFLLIFTCSVSVFAALPIVYDAGSYGCLPGSNSYTKSSNPAISNTDYDSIYLSECYSNTNYPITVIDADIIPGNSYTIYLHFAEIYHGAGNSNTSGGDGSRIFHVNVEGVRILDSLDIHKMVGPASALVYRYDVQIGMDGDLDIEFLIVTGDAKISAMEIRQLGEASDFPPTTSIIDLTSGVLPVTLTSFEAVPTGRRTVSLSWNTSSEINHLGFELEMAAEGKDFEYVEFFQGEGTETEGAAYNFETELLSAGTYRFRLKQIDLDGAVFYSRQIQVLIDAGEFQVRTVVFPNPSDGLVNLLIETDQPQDVNIQLFSIDGKPVGQLISLPVTAGAGNQIPLNLETVPSGIYFLNIKGRFFQRQEKIILK